MDGNQKCYVVSYPPTCTILSMVERYDFESWQVISHESLKSPTSCTLMYCMLIYCSLMYEIHTNFILQAMNAHKAWEQSYYKCSVYLVSIECSKFSPTKVTCTVTGTWMCQFAQYPSRSLRQTPRLSKV